VDLLREIVEILREIVEILREIVEILRDEKSHTKTYIKVNCNVS
jgi:hypothetical protein